MTEPRAPSNIAAQLRARARERPDAFALVCPIGEGKDGKTVYREWSFAELDQLSDAQARGLQAVGVGHGTRAAVLVPPSIEFFALSFALFKLGAVPVLIDPGIGRKHLGRCLDEAEPEAYIGIPLAQVARVVLGWARASVRISVTVGRRWLWGGHSLAQLTARGRGDLPFTIADTADCDTAAILFTSGSTGPPKGAVYQHGNFSAQIETLRVTYGIEPGEVDLPTFPLFALFDPALGSTAILPVMDFTRPGAVDPRCIVDPIERFGVTSMFGSPALLDRVGRHGSEHQLRLPSLKRVISAGAPVAPIVLERFSTMLSADARIHTPYGATEALPVSTIASDEILSETRKRTEIGAGVCVGMAVAGIEIRVIRIDDAPLATIRHAQEVPPLEVGEIVVKGAVVTHAYYRRPEATAAAKMADADGSIWHRMGDLGYFDSGGRLWFVGRKSQRVITSDGTLYTIPTEAVFNQHPGVRRTALVGVPGDDGQRPVLMIEKEFDTNIDEAQLRAGLNAIAARFPHTRSIKTFLFHPSFPVDVRHNAKIFREQLAVFAAEELGA